MAPSWNPPISPLPPYPRFVCPTPLALEPRGLERHARSRGGLRLGRLGGGPAGLGGLGLFRIFGFGSELSGSSLPKRFFIFEGRLEMNESVTVIVCGSQNYIKTIISLGRLDMNSVRTCYFFCVPRCGPSTVLEEHRGLSKLSTGDALILARGTSSGLDLFSESMRPRNELSDMDCEM